MEFTIRRQSIAIAMRFRDTDSARHAANSGLKSSSTRDYFFSSSSKPHHTTPRLVNSITSPPLVLIAEVAGGTLAGGLRDSEGRPKGGARGGRRTEDGVGRAKDEVRRASRRATEVKGAKGDGEL